jgi:2-polyprenyl-6-methoxyphenol hydroxylase-like FAD-dependent oxidoreductase
MVNQPCTNSVLVAGAGIGGLTAALSLHATGVAATVIESARDIRPLGVGINLLPHAVRELTELGLGADLAAIAIATAENVYLDAAGRRFWTDPRGRALGYLWPQYSVHRGQLQMLLLAAARERLGPDAIRVGTRLDDFDQTPTQVRARVTDRVSGATEEIEADVLIGADGLHSTVLARLHHRAPPLHWSGVQMWRGLTEAEPFLTGRSVIIANDPAATRLVAYPISTPNPETGRALINWVCLVSVAEPGPLPGDVGWNRPGRVRDVLPHESRCPSHSSLIRLRK